MFEEKMKNYAVPLILQPHYLLKGLNLKCDPQIVEKFINFCNLDTFIKQNTDLIRSYLLIYPQCNLFKTKDDISDYANIIQSSEQLHKKQQNLILKINKDLSQNCFNIQQDLQSGIIDILKSNQTLSINLAAKMSCIKDILKKYRNFISQLISEVDVFSLNDKELLSKYLLSKSLIQESIDWVAIEPLLEKYIDLEDEKSLVPIYSSIQKQNPGLTNIIKIIEDAILQNVINYDTSVLLPLIKNTNNQNILIKVSQRRFLPKTNTKLILLLIDKLSYYKLPCELQIDQVQKINDLPIQSLCLIFSIQTFYTSVSGGQTNELERQIYNYGYPIHTRSLQFK
ncbi:hypothetical protein pb186bvf_005601 [Paramecium bursaria]